MPKFLFWNLNKKPLADSLARLVVAHDIDVLMMAECEMHPTDVLVYLNRDGLANYHFAPCILCTKIKIFTRFADRFLPPVAETDRLSIRKMILPNSPEILLAVVHMVSKLQYSEATQVEEARELSRNIREAEDVAAHRRTILVGDLNMNPFEHGMVSTGALNATMTRSVALKSDRRIQGRLYPYFYNPMWGHFGDATDTPAGTHYYAKSDHICYYWNMFDQVLLRPDLLGMWQPNSLRILRSDGVEEFIDLSGKRAGKNMSDHLPIVFELNF